MKYKNSLYFLMNTVSLLLLYTYEMKIIITCYQISFEIFMLSILHILYMDSHVRKYIIWYFNNKSNSEVIIWNFIQIIYLYLSQYCKQDLSTWTVTWKNYDSILLNLRNENDNYHINEWLIYVFTIIDSDYSNKISHSSFELLYLYCVYFIHIFTSNIYEISHTYI